MSRDVTHAARVDFISERADTNLTKPIEVLRAIAFEKKYDIRCIAKHYGVTPRQFRSQFRARMACNPHQWLREERMQRARQMLRASSSVKQVAYALGFKSESQFCRDFRLRFGRTPSSDLAPSWSRFSTLFDDVDAE